MKRKQYLFLWFIVYTFTVAAVMTINLYCGNNPKEQKPAVNTVKFSPIPWTNFRGNAGLDGVSSGNVSDSLKLLWSFKTGGSCISSPVTDGKNVYIGSLDSSLYSLDMVTGNPVWKIKLEDEIEASPLIFNEMVLIGDLNGNFYSINKQNGGINWTFKAGGVRNKIVGSANVIQDKGLVLFGSHNDTLYCLNALDGEVIWKYESGSYINGTPAADGEYIVIGGCDAYLHIINASKGSLIGKVDAGSHIAGSAVLKEPFAYVGSYGRKLLGINIKTMEIVWTYENSGGRREPFFASPALTDTFLIAPSRDKFVHAVSSLTGNLIWKFMAKGAIDSSPVIAGERVVVACEAGTLYLLDLKSGAPVNSLDVGASISGTPLVSGGIVVVGDDDGVVSAFN